VCFVFTLYVFDFFFLHIFVCRHARILNLARQWHFFLSFLGLLFPPAASQMQSLQDWLKNQATKNLVLCGLQHDVCYNDRGVSSLLPPLLAQSQHSTFTSAAVVSSPRNSKEDNDALSLSVFVRRCDVQVRARGATRKEYSKVNGVFLFFLSTEVYCRILYSFTFFLSLLPIFLFRKIFH
jgi:hypothetical protein